jgi:hypothetical protein
MIRNFEKEILTKINFVKLYLDAEKKYIKNGLSELTFKKQEILSVFKEIGEPCEYRIGGGYVINRKQDTYLFNLLFDIKYNVPLMYFEILKNGQFINTGLTQYGSVLREIPYDKSDINEKFGLNSLTDLKDYIVDMIIIFKVFVNEYMLEIENCGYNDI